MKYTGLGFNLDLDSFEIIINEKIRLKNDENNLKFSLFDVDEYKMAVCSKYSVIEPPHPKRGWGFLNYFHLIGLI